MTEQELGWAREVGIKNLRDWGYTVVNTDIENVVEVSYKRERYIKRMHVINETTPGIIRERLIEMMRFAPVKEIGVKADGEKNATWIALENAENYLQKVKFSKELYVVCRDEFEDTIDLSNFEFDEEGQCELWTELSRLEGWVVADIESEFDLYESSHSTDYEYARGEEMDSDDIDSEYINGRVYDATQASLDDFWSFEYNDFFKDQMNYLDPFENVAVVHRKGKDWYVGSAVTAKDDYIKYIDPEVDNVGQYTGDYYIKEEWFETKMYKSEPYAIAKIAEFIEEMVLNVELKGIVERAVFQMDEYACSFPKKLFQSLEEQGLMEMYDVKSEILDEVYAQNGSKEAVQAIEEFLRHNTSEEKLFGKFSHLKKLKRLAEADGYEIIEDNELGYRAYALSYKKEVYHFLLADLYDSDYIGFYGKMVKKITKRLLEKKKFQGLLDKAKMVFVSVQDSLDSGNCSAGTETFCKKHGIDTRVIGGIRGDVILEKELSNFTRRVVIEAITKRGKK